MKPLFVLANVLIRRMKPLVRAMTHSLSSKRTILAWSTWGILALNFITPVLADAPVDVVGITDASYGNYSDRASFRVPSTNGYSYRVLLDSSPIPTDVTIDVTKV